MQTNQEQLIADMVAASRLKGKAKEELRRELLSHFHAQRCELELEGRQGEAVNEIMAKSFGDTTALGKQIHVVYTRRRNIMIQVTIIMAILILMILFSFVGVKQAPTTTTLPL